MSKFLLHLKQVEVGGQLYGVDFLLLYMGPGDETSVAWQQALLPIITLLALSHLTSPAPSFHGTTYRQLEDQSRDFKICLIFSALQPRISVSF